MLDATLKTQLQAYLEKVVLPFEIVASLDDSAKSQELLGLLQKARLSRIAFVAEPVSVAPAASR